MFNIFRKKKKADEVILTTESADDAQTAQFREFFKSKLTADVVLVSVGNNIIEVIKTIRNTVGCDLAQAKNLAENAPITIAENCLEEQAMPMIAALVSVGAEVELK